jgi:hypothetical protein
MRQTSFNIAKAHKVYLVGRWKFSEKAFVAEPFLTCEKTNFPNAPTQRLVSHLIEVKKKAEAVRPFQSGMSLSLGLQIDDSRSVGDAPMPPFPASFAHRATAQYHAGEVKFLSPLRLGRN